MNIILAAGRPKATAKTRFDPAPVIAGCLMFALVLFLTQILNDGDTFWQITTGGWILDHHTIPSIDPFSFTAGSRPWFAHEWLAETLMALAWRAGGMQAVMLLTATAIGLTAAVLLHHLRRFLPGVYAVTAMIIALCNAAPSMLARPHLLAWPCLALWCGGLVAARADRTAPSFALLPVMLVWVNLHGSFMVGLLLSGALMVEALLDPGIDRTRVVAAWGKFIAAAWAVALLNPDLLAGVLFPFHMLGMKSLAWIGEWAPADFSHWQLAELMILVALALGLSGRLTLPPVRLLLLLVLIHGALTHMRNGQLLGIVGALIIAEPAGACLARGGAELLGRRWRLLSAGTVFIAILAVAARIALPLPADKTGANFAATLDAVSPAVRAQPVLNEYGLGAELIFNGVRPFIDSRADLYGDTFLSQYRHITAPERTELDRALSDYHIAWTIFPVGHAMIPAMDEKPGWHRLLDKDGMVAHVRNDVLPP